MYIFKVFISWHVILYFVALRTFIHVFEHVLWCIFICVTGQEKVLLKTKAKASLLLLKEYCQ